MAKKQKRNKNTSKNIIIFILSVLLIAALTFGVIVFIKQIKSDNSKSDQDNALDQNTADTELKTEEDFKDEDKVAKSSNDAKDRMEADEKVKSQTKQDESGKNIAEPVVSFVSEEDGKIAAGGAIYNINESGGTCTYILSKGDTDITVSAGILPNRSYISCETVRVDKAKFTKGTWQVKIQYKSNLSEGESETQSITIQ
jgi:cytoskeletal protein RodZ